MIIIEAGATHTKVCSIVNHQISEVKLYKGINPNYMLDEAIISILQECLSQATRDTRVHYYGTGCASLVVQERMQNLIRDKFEIQHVSIYSDLLASARASAKTESGQINILGTGSASCIYDGNQITKILPNYGYIFGDYGSGYRLGYALLQAYFNDQFDSHIQQEIEAYSNMKKETLLRYIYQAESKSRIVKFAKCVHQLKDNALVNKLIITEFRSFISRQIKLHSDYLDSDQYFTGSIAYYFRSELDFCLQEHDLTIKKICISPIEELCAFHLTYNQ